MKFLKAALASLREKFEQAVQERREAEIRKTLPIVKENLAAVKFKNIPVKDLAEIAFKDFDLSEYGDDADFVAQGLGFMAARTEYFRIHDPAVAVICEAQELAAAEIHKQEEKNLGSTGVPRYGFPHFVNVVSSNPLEKSNTIANTVYCVVAVKHGEKAPKIFGELYHHARENVRAVAGTMPAPPRNPAGVPVPA